MVNRAVYDKLTATARARELVTYGEVAALLSLDMELPADRNTLAGILGAISEAEHERGRPMLSAVVVHAGDPFPGPGFFSLARQLGKLVGRTKMDQLEFFSKELAAVHRTWGRPVRRGGDARALGAPPQKRLRIGLIR